MLMIIRKPKHETVPPGRCDAYIEAVRDLGICETRFGEKDQLEITFTTSHKNAAGELIQLKKRYTKSLAARSNLLSLATVLLQGAVPEAFDPDLLVGSECQLIISNDLGKDGKTWSNIGSVLPPRTQSAPQPPESFMLPAEVRQ